jgi:hypothetical protein
VIVGEEDQLVAARTAEAEHGQSAAEAEKE